MQVIRLELLFQLAEHGIQARGDLLARHDQRQAVDAAGGILDAHAVALEHLEHLPERAHARGHTGLGNGDDGVVFLARDAGDEPTVVHVVERLHDERAGVVGVVGVADVERDVLLAHGEHRPLVQHLRAYVAKLP